MRKSIKKLLTLLLLAVFVTASVAPTLSVEAATKNAKKETRIFKDVTTKTSYYKQIEWLYKHGAYAGIATKGKNFKPNQIMTRGEFVRMLKNLYGERIELSTDNAKTKCTQKYITSTLTKVSKQLGFRVTWSGGAPKARVTRSKASLYVRQMMNTADGALDP